MNNCCKAKLEKEKPLDLNLIALKKIKIRVSGVELNFLFEHDI